MKNIEDYLHKNSLIYPDKVAVVCNGMKWTYAQLWQQVENRAKELTKNGLLAGRPQIIRASQSTDFLVTYFAIHLVGAVAVPLEASLPDEPYREIVFTGEKAPYVSQFYKNSISAYSYSKSLSLPGERIGYLAVNPKCTDADKIALMCGQISRGIGHNCPPSSIQLAVAKVLDKTSDLSVYEKNRDLLYQALVEIGFSVVKPGGTFYIFPKALEEDAKAFCRKAKEYDLILVPADGFGCPGYFRMAYCIDTDKVKRSIPILKQFAREVYGVSVC